ncbi:MAG: RagB/SusD family nutrient uptake outer membrane protein [Bacteroidota bacterium]|nr:RagB/SusD family nutrient uptake outer membrane protein [Bacteroidota bacterium]
MKRIVKITFIFSALALFLASCVKDLDTTPINPKQTTNVDVYTSVTNYKEVLAKCYAGLAVSGQQGPAGNPDISGIDEGFGEYLRAYWYHQELPTDEAVIGWNDQTIKDFHNQTWGSSDVFIAAMYYRIFYQISLCNEFIRESTDAKLDERGFSGQDRTDIQLFRAEARFLRALSYYHALDLFGNVPFVTENDKVEKFFPNQISRADLFKYIESELLAIEPLVAAARTNEYGRADAGAVDFLLAKLYLNAEVYTGTARYTDCITYCNKVIADGYALDSKYENLFLADNSFNNEVIFPITFDGTKTKTYGGTTFIIHAAIGGSMVPLDYGVAGGWGGTRTTSAFVSLFPSQKSYSPKPKSTKSYPVLYVPGSYQGWDPTNTSTVIASVKSDGNYEGYLYFPDANTSFKICQNPNWDVNWGDNGADGTLDPGGDNIQAADAGYYKLNVNLNNLTYTLVKTTWGIIGDATANGWDSDQDMTFDASTGLWKATLDLKVGSIKFRANHAWDINYGDTGLDGILDAGGDNIPITVAGNYNITLKLGVPDYTYTIVQNSYDHRAMFYTDGQSLQIKDIGTFTDGYAITKWKNVTSSGAQGSDQTYCDTDFPLFRLADAYLMYAEAVLRGGSGGDLGTALNYVNAIRTRAYAGDTKGNISQSELKLSYILDERGRELYWEATRRTDLIRFGEFTGGSYLWPWKGGVANGISTKSQYNLFPIPSADITANPNLHQNLGY